MKTVVITGTSSGIGKDLASFLKEKGYQVIGISRNIKEQETGIHYIACDITKEEEVQKALIEIKNQYGSIDALINNAGMGIAGAIENTPLEEIRLQMEVNVFGQISFTQTFLPLLKKNAHIVFVGSVAGHLTIPYQGFYSMSKSALESFSEALSMELKEKGIRVTTVLPGDTKTDFTFNRRKTKEMDTKVNHSIQKMEKDEQKGASPRKVSKTIYHVLKRKNPPIRVAVGFQYKLFLFIERILPRRWVLFIIRKLYM